MADRAVVLGLVVRGPVVLLRNKRPKSLQINDPVVTSFFHFQPAEGGLVAVVPLWAFDVRLSFLHSVSSC